ncbi:MAG: hypothetical protein A2135_07050 [Actinobacteria bacterium RBG_16_67_15]|nr:MAG: hypothetical protein A2135_07050 [Actinobacteria bacterium RBG_16_67_15]
MRGVVATFVSAAPDPSRVIRVGSDQEPFDVETGVILTQVLNHSTEHRSQIFSILTGLGLGADLRPLDCKRGLSAFRFRPKRVPRP